MRWRKLIGKTSGTPPLINFTSEGAKINKASLREYERKYGKMERLPVFVKVGSPRHPVETSAYAQRPSRPGRIRDGFPFDPTGRRLSRYSDHKQMIEDSQYARYTPFEYPECFPGYGPDFSDLYHSEYSGVEPYDHPECFPGYGPDVSDLHYPEYSGVDPLGHFNGAAPPFGQPHMQPGPANDHAPHAPGFPIKHPSREGVGQRDWASQAPKHPAARKPQQDRVRTGKLPEGAQLPTGVKDPFATVSAPKPLGHFGLREHVKGMSRLKPERHGRADDPKANWKAMDEIQKLQDAKKRGGGGGGGTNGKPKNGDHKRGHGRK